MAAEPNVTHAVHHDDIAEAQKLGIPVDEVVAARITEEDLLRVSRECLTIRSATGWRIFLIMVVMGANQAGYGVDWGVIGGINSVDRWHSYYGFGNSGPIIGTINALMQIGGFLGAPFLSLGDVIGRRGVNWLGNALSVVGAVLQAAAPNTACLMVGRMVLGFGTALCTAPQYMAEIAPVHLRGRLVGIFGACFQVGSLAMTGVMMGLTKLDSDWEFRAAFIIQSVFPLFVCLTIYVWCPESPRYLILKGRREEAIRVLAKYQTTDNDINAPIVPLVVQQIDESLETTRAGVRAAWDYRVFFTRAVWYRTMLLLVYAAFQQWNGGGIIGNYLSPALATIGITGTLEQLGINLGLTATYFVFTLFGSYLIDIFRRRTLIFAGLISFVILQIAVTITSWRYSENPSQTAAVLTLLWIYLFQICSSSFIATMHNLYPVELLSLPLRAKGMGLFAMFQGALGVVQNYGISVGIADIGYKIWAVYIVYNFLQLIVSYFVFPETSRLSLEEIDSVFETPGTNPVKLSLKIQKARKERESLEREEGRP